MLVSIVTQCPSNNYKQKLFSFLIIFKTFRPDCSYNKDAEDAIGNERNLDFIIHFELWLDTCFTVKWVAFVTCTFKHY